MVTIMSLAGDDDPATWLSRQLLFCGSRVVGVRGAQLALSSLDPKITEDISYNHTLLGNQGCIALF